MYKRILLSYDGSLEGRTALREGALMARQCGAEVFLLSVLVDSGKLLLPEVALAGAFVHTEDDFMDILNEGVARLRKLGLDPTAKLVRGQPADEIGNFARQIGALGPSRPRSRRMRKDQCARTLTAPPSFAAKSSRRRGQWFS
jgi:nucleotide-binding universal stress UspA family protein